MVNLKETVTAFERLESTLRRLDGIVDVGLQLIEEVRSLREIRDDFVKLHDLAQRLDADAPEAPGAFTGTVSERITRRVRALQAETICDICYGEFFDKGRHCACRGTGKLRDTLKYLREEVIPANERLRDEIKRPGNLTKAEAAAYEGVFVPEEEKP